MTAQIHTFQRRDPPLGAGAWPHEDDPPPNRAELERLARASVARELRTRRIAGVVMIASILISFFAMAFLIHRIMSWIGI
jgi:hypothetical protein